jgi:hypothetical protein
MIHVKKIDLTLRHLTLRHFSGRSKEIIIWAAAR